LRPFFDAQAFHPSEEFRAHIPDPPGARTEDDEVDLFLFAIFTVNSRFPADGNSHLRKRTAILACLISTARGNLVNSKQPFNLIFFNKLSAMLGWNPGNTLTVSFGFEQRKCSTVT
jgi:hypothetical protein